MTEFLKTTTANKGANMGKLIKDPNMANPVTSTSKCGQALGACGAVAGYKSVTGNTLDGDGPTVWDGKEWPVPMKTYVVSTDGAGEPDGVSGYMAIREGRAILLLLDTAAQVDAHVLALGARDLALGGEEAAVVVLALPLLAAGARAAAVGGGGREERQREEQRGGQARQASRAARGARHPSRGHPSAGRGPPTSSTRGSISSRRRMPGGRFPEHAWPRRAEFTRQL